MQKVSFAVRQRLLGASAVVLTVGALTALIGPVWSGGLDRNQVCVSNVKALTLGIAEYTQDYDERLPLPVAFSNISNFQKYLVPYIKNIADVVRCPANGNALYTPNAALGSNSLASFADTYTVEVMRDSKPHPDGKLTVGFLDGHVERGGVFQSQPDITCRQNQQMITQGLQEYVQDYDERTPFQQNDTAFRQALQPYLRSSHLWTCPDTQKPYTIGQDFRGKTIASFPDTAPVIVVQDSAPHPSGIITTAYLDGYIEQRGPKGVTYPPAYPTLDQEQTNFKHISLAMIEYSQDYDERFPIYKNYTDLLPLLAPYVNEPFYSSRSIQMLNQPTYQADPQYSGLTQASIQFPASTIYLRDTYDFGDGLITVGYLDGHVNRIPK